MIIQSLKGGRFPSFDSSMALHPLSPDPAATSPLLLTKQYSSDQTYPQHTGSSRSNSNSNTGHHTSISWDFKSHLKNLEHDYDEFDPRHARESHLVYADGDVPKNKVGTTDRTLAFKLTPLP